METEWTYRSGRTCVSENGWVMKKPVDTKNRARKRTGYEVKRLFFILAIIVLTGIRSFAATDVLFLIDSTGSMAGINSIKMVLDDILTAIDADSLCPENIMYGVADYKNYTDGGNYTAYGVNLVQPFTSSFQATLSAINGLTAGGGGDPPESQLKAMVSIADNWLTPSGDLGFNGRPGAQRILIWSGDAPGHVAGDEPGSDGPPPDGYYPSLDETIDALKSEWIMVFALNSANCNAGLNKLYGYPERQQAEEITDATGGTLFCNVGSGGTVDMNIIIEAILCVSLFKDDGIDPTDCVIPEQEITYEICWTNLADQTYYNAYIIDWLPEGVTYPQGAWMVEMGDPNDPNEPPFTLLPPDPGYDPGTHSYVWPLGDIAPEAIGCVELTVVVNDKAVPGGILHNVAEIYGTVYDPNHQNPVERLVARMTRDTNVCCYTGVVEEVFVDQSATNGSNTGTSWQNAYLELQDALNYARSSACAKVHSIYVAQGPYSPGDHTWNTFEIPDGVSVYGGFPQGGSEFWQRNPTRYKTTLSGRIDDTTRNDTVVTMRNETLLDGFTVSEAAEYGIYGSGVDFEVENCVIVNAAQHGIRTNNGNVSIKWSRIYNSDRNGIDHRGLACRLNIENSIITRNGRYGIHCQDSIPVIKNSIISDNGFDVPGFQGVYVWQPFEPPVLYNNTIVNNAKAGIFWFDDQDSSGDPNNLDWPDIQNCIIWYNNDGKSQVEGFTTDYTAWYSCIQDCNEVNYNINVEPKFAYTIGPDGLPDPNNYHLAYDSPCKNMGNPSHTVYDVGFFDIDGEARIVDGRIDIGADEIYSCAGNLTEDDIYNPLDWNADGIVNIEEFLRFSRAWLSYDPNHPLCDPEHPHYISDPNHPNYIDELDKLRFDPLCDLNGDLHVGLVDFLIFVDDWLWMACWKWAQINRFETTQPMSMNGDGMFMLSDDMARMTTVQADITYPVSIEEEKTYTDMSDMELALRLATIFDVLHSVEYAIEQDHENVEGLHEIKTFLEQYLEDMWPSRQ